MLAGDTVGHEPMCEVVDLGSAARNRLKTGDRFVVPFTAVRRGCEQGRRSIEKVYEETGRKTVPGDPTRAPTIQRIAPNHAYEIDRHRPTGRARCSATDTEDGRRRFAGGDERQVRRPRLERVR